jgi:sugar/nucleoside kinase (ribokinase family)
LVDKKKDIIGLSNLPSDIIVEVSEEFIKGKNLKKGDSVPFDTLPWEAELPNWRIIPGGSSANMIVCASNQLFLNFGLRNRNGLIGTLGDDVIGSTYKKASFKNVIDYTTVIKGGRSMVVYVLITPDAERTQLFNLGVSGDFRLPYSKIDDFRYFHLTLYEVDANEKKAFEALNYAEEHGLKISFDLAAPNLISEHIDKINEIVKKATVLIGNEAEVKAFTKLDARGAVEELSNRCDVAIVKVGAKGSYIKKSNGPIHEIPPFRVNSIDSTGAGDTYLAGFYLGVLRGHSIERSGRIASQLGAMACEVYGGRLNKRCSINDVRLTNSLR